ncbi:hypothetical protein HJC23_012693 [Cyclotella cryptica]|uniref:BZIP domain-containing protein n=1 Tax=Cyclotella cryptica TaxID=29204 RepID=A0ABD3PMJ1_9STRA|eukprot:CCRYP_013313-RA/>CCRYP_013313-RA protein AED:0.48 eAED:0.48 QI:0/-1/0/1/-1/1/1/0/209
MNHQHHGAVAIEEEPPHEIYASLVASSLAADQSTAIAREASGGKTVRGNGPSNRHAASSTHISGSNEFDRGNGQMIPTDPVMITAEDEDLLPRTSSASQFIQFYHKSCRDSKHRSHKQGLSGGGSDPANTSRRKTNSQVNTKQIKSQHPMCHNGKKSFQTHATRTTKAERRLISRRERERQISKDKQISIMLRSDISDEYSSLYNQLHR